MRKGILLAVMLACLALLLTPVVFSQCGIGPCAKNCGGSQVMNELPPPKSDYPDSDCTVTQHCYTVNCGDECYAGMGGGFAEYHCDDSQWNDNTDNCNGFADCPCFNW